MKLAEYGARIAHVEQQSVLLVDEDGGLERVDRGPGGAASQRGPQQHPAAHEGDRNENDVLLDELQEIDPVHWRERTPQKTSRIITMSWSVRWSLTE